MKPTYCQNCTSSKPLRPDGRCVNCENRAIRRNNGPSTCHPDRKAHSKGLCSPCYRAQLNNYASCHPDKPRVTASGLCQNCYNHLPETTERMKASHRFRAYGITQEDYQKLVEAQGIKNGKVVCAICDSYGLVIDHDHKTKKVRGILCKSCNIALGHFKDDITVLAKAISYVGDNHDQK